MTIIEKMYAGEKLSETDTNHRQQGREVLIVSPYAEKLDYEDALWMAIAALRPVSRERVEQIYPGCPKCWARGDRNVLNDPGAHDFRLKDSALVYWDEHRDSYYD